MALGCIGMSLADFCRCTPSEFRHIADRWDHLQQQREHSRWERLRHQCLCSLQPYSKKRLQARDIMEFPWEKEEDKKITVAVTDDELRKRYKAARERFGLE